MTKILQAVRALTKGMIAKPVPCDPRMRVSHSGARKYESWTEVNRRCL